MLSCGRERFDPASDHSRIASCWFKLACSLLGLWLVHMECSLYTITQRFEGSVLNTDLKTVIKRKQEGGWGGEAPCAQALQRMLNFPLAQLKILTYRTAQWV